MEFGVKRNWSWRCGGLYNQMLDWTASWGWLRGVPGWVWGFSPEGRFFFFPLLWGVWSPSIPDSDLLELARVTVWPLLLLLFGLFCLLTFDWLIVLNGMKEKTDCIFEGQSSKNIPNCKLNLSFSPSSVTTDLSWANQVFLWFLYHVDNWVFELSEM